MRRNNIGCVLIAGEDGECRGLVTDRDIALALGGEDCKLDSALKSLMSAPLVWVEEHESIDEVAERMIDNGVRRVPVLQSRRGKRHACGIITLDDLIEDQLAPPTKIRAIVKSQNAGPADPKRQKAKRRSEARQSQTYREFLNDLAQHCSLQSEQAEQLAHALLAHIVHRIHPNEASHFITQLPAKFHATLLATKTGPDRSITQEVFVDEVVKLLACDAAQAREVIAKFWKCLQAHVSPGELEDVLGQMPKEAQNLFTAA